MSKTNENHIKRQWQIIQFLIGQENYTSSDDVLKNLQENGFDVKERTVQRDLNALAEIFPIECRKDDKPYSWRWQRVEQGKKNLMTYEQALIFMLVDNELRDFLPDDLLNRLEPLFIRAKLTVADVDYQNLQRNRTNPMIVPSQIGGAKSLHQFHTSQSILANLKNLFGSKKSNQGLEFSDESLDKDSIIMLQYELEKFGLSEFAVELARFIQMNKL